MAVHSLTTKCLCRQQDLYRILKAYTIYRPDEGYCQAQAPVAAVLLMHMPAEVRWGGEEVVVGGVQLSSKCLQDPDLGSSPLQQAFWCLVTICEKYLPGYYSAGLVSSPLNPGHAPLPHSLLLSRRS